MGTYKGNESSRREFLLAREDSYELNWADLG